MKYIEFILIISLQYFIICKVFEDEQNIYKFSLKQTNELTNLGPNNISYDIIFNIYSRDKEQNNGWIIILKYLNNNKKSFKPKNKKKYTKIINEDYYKLIPNHIDIEEFEEPNFSFNKFSYLKQNKNRKEKLKFVNNSPLIKFTFTKNGIINIYRPDNLSDLDFFDFVQSLNRIIFANRDRFFIGQSFEDIKEEKLSSKNLIDFCQNIDFKYNLFAFKYMGISIRGYISAFSLSNNEMDIIFNLTYKFLENNEAEIFSLGPFNGNSEIICSYIKKLKRIENFIYQYINKDKLKMILNILNNINKKELLNNPSIILKILASKFSQELMNLLKYLLGIIIDFINKYFKGFKSQILKNVILLNNSFMKSFFSTDNIILDKINKHYEDLIKSEFTKKIFENMEYSKEKIKDFSGNVLKNGYEKIKDISNSETVKNIKSACEDISNSIGDKVKGYFK